MTADISSSLSSWSTTESSNQPQGSTAISTNLDDNLRMIQAVVKGISTGGQALATPNVGAATGTSLVLSGPITSNGIKEDSVGNIGLGVVPSAWNADVKAYEVKASGNSISSSASNNIYMTNNAVLGNSGFVYGDARAASYYSQGSGAHIWYTAPVGVAGNAITFTQTMALDANGNLIQTVNSAAPSLTSNKTLAFELTNDTTLKIKVRGSDGVTRSATLTLA